MSIRCAYYPVTKLILGSISLPEHNTLQALFSNIGHIFSVNVKNPLHFILYLLHTEETNSWKKWTNKKEHIILFWKCLIDRVCKSLSEWPFAITIALHTLWYFFLSPCSLMACKPAVWLTEIEVRNIKILNMASQKSAFFYFIHKTVQRMAKFSKLIP